MTLPSADPNLEPRLSDKPPLRDDTRFAAGKIAVFQYATVIIFLFLMSGFWRLQVQNPEFYGERAQQNSIKSVPIPGPRGRILDRDGRVIRVDLRAARSKMRGELGVFRIGERSFVCLGECAESPRSCDELTRREPQRHTATRNPASFAAARYWESHPTQLLFGAMVRRIAVSTVAMG